MPNIIPTKFSSYTVFLHYAVAAAITFSTGGYMVDEGAMTVDVCMDLLNIPSNGIASDIVIPIHTESGEACKCYHQFMILKNYHFYCYTYSLSR